MAIRRIYFNITEHQRTEIVDADLADYFGKIPHGDLMRCISRRVTDGQLLSVLKLWLEIPVIERNNDKNKRSTEAKDKHRGIPQGSPCSPLLSNLYFRRFILAWDKFGFTEAYDTQIVNYADDFVICTKPGKGQQVMDQMLKLMSSIGLQVNKEKTKLVKLPAEKFDFLGYTFGKFFGKGGKAYIGTQPSKKSIRKVIEKLHEETSRQWGISSEENRVVKLNSIIRGGSNYFNQGPVIPIYENIQKYLRHRLRQWLARKHKFKGSRYRQYPDKYLYDQLGLIKLPKNRAELLRAKA